MVIPKVSVHFRKEHFKTAVPLTITVMLVMYTLKGSITNQLPTTSYIKTIDIWFLYGVLMPFLNLLTIVLQEHMPDLSPVSLIKDLWNCFLIIFGVSGAKYEWKRKKKITNGFESVWISCLALFPYSFSVELCNHGIVLALITCNCYIIQKYRIHYHHYSKAYRNECPGRRNNINNCV